MFVSSPSTYKESQPTGSALSSFQIILWDQIFSNLSMLIARVRHCPKNKVRARPEHRAQQNIALATGRAAL